MSQETATSFNADGDTVVAFETQGGDRAVGVVVWGRTCGIYAEGLRDQNHQTGRTGALTKTGVGVHGRGDNIGVSGEGFESGVAGNGIAVGVQGTGNRGLKGQGLSVGVVGEGAVGISGEGTEINVQGAHIPADVGVSGTGPVGVRGDGTKRGVVGKGPVGISGEGTDVEVPGIRIIPADVGVNGKGPVGVRGESDVDSDRAIGVQGTVKRGTGIVGQSEEGTGIVGQSEEGNAGSFSSKRLAQIHLEPLSIPTPVGTVPGKGGDLLATKDLEGSTTLWFCVGDGDATTAVWKQIA